MFACLIIGVMGCSRHADDARLLRADSLMTVAPDSAYAVLAAVDTSLLDDADRAYYALLRTQCDYKCYIPATDSALIVAALAWYHRHPQGDRLTRAMLHRGTVAEEMGNPVDAIKWYRHAEANADTADHNMLGYINLRIADLYMGEYAKNERANNYAQIAINHFKQINCTHYEIASILTLAALTYQDTCASIALFKNAFELADETHDSANVAIAGKKLSHLYLAAGDCEKSKHYASVLLRHYNTYLDDNICAYNLCRAYLCLNQLDSAKKLFNQLPPPCNREDSVMWLNLMVKFSMEKGDVRAYEKWNEKAEDYVDSVVQLSRSQDLLFADNEFDLMQSRAHQARLKNIALLVVTLLLAIIAIIVAMHLHRSNQNARKYQRERHQNLLELEALQKRHDIEMKDAEESYTQSIETLKQASVYRKAVEAQLNNALMVAESKSFHRFINDAFWKNLFCYANLMFNNLLERAVAAGMNKKEEQKFFALCCLELPNSIIALIMDYTNTHYVTNKKAKLLKDYFNHQGPFSDFLEQEHI